MKINPIQPNAAVNNYAKVQHKESVRPDQGQETDKVELSKEAITYSLGMKEAKTAMSVRTPEETKRVESVIQQVKNNTYSVPGKDVAEKILGE